MYFLSKFHLRILALFMEKKKVISHQTGSGKEKKQYTKGETQGKANDIF